MDQKASPVRRSFGILGDSYSTFRGYIPEGQDYYYPSKNVDDVLQVEHTWWHRLMQKGMVLLRNDSYSGATVCADTRPGQPPGSAFTERVKCSFSGDLQPDYLILFGGTNDSWLNRTVGQVQFADWTETDLLQVLPAYCFILDHMTKHNPRSQVVAVLNTNLNPQMHSGMVEAARHYGATPVVLADIDKQCGHPTALGMQQIASQIWAALG